MLRSVLVPLDLSSNGDLPLERVGRLPLAADAQVTLLHVVSKRSSSAQQQGERLLVARRALERARLELPAPVRERTTLVVETGAVDEQVAAVGSRVKADLTLVGGVHRHAVRSALFGSAPERLMRRLQKPILVARTRAAAAYTRPLLALSLDAAAERALALMLRVVPPPRPAWSLVHVYQGPHWA